MGRRITNLLLTGPPRCGKTTLVRRVIERLDGLRVRGFYTREVRGDDGRRVGFEAVGLSGGSAMLASVRWKSRLRVGEYGVELTGFEELLAEELHRESGDVELIDLNVIDEIGKMECFSRLFVELASGVLDGDVPALATIAMRGRGFIQEVKARDDVELITVDAANRDRLVDELVGRVKLRG